MITLKHIQKAVKSRLSIDEIKAVIQQYLIDNKLESDYTVNSWAKANANLLRRWAYPTVEQICEAYLKIYSNTEPMLTEGHDEMTAHLERYIAVNNKFPNI